MIVERTSYYAKPGRSAEVLAIRRHASAVRVKLGLAVGTIYVKAGGDGPDVRWECVYTSQAEYDQDLAARGGSPDFEAVRVSMRNQIDRFERHVDQRDTGPLANGMVDTPLADIPVVPREI